LTILAFLNSYPPSLIPAQRHIGKLSWGEPLATSCMAAPVQRSDMAAFDIAAHTADGAHHVLDDVGAGQPAARLGVEAKADAGQDFVETIQDARTAARELANPADWRGC
jgi:hypothetical protein